MNSFRERPKSWIADHSPSSEPPDRETSSWIDSDTSTNAISFGFAATAVLISLFLIMAIFEHLIRPRAFFSRSQTDSGRTFNDPSQPQPQMHSLGKLKNPPPQVRVPYQSDYSVLMPGQQCPTYLAQPAPLPCQREGIHWPSHNTQAWASP